MRLYMDGQIRLALNEALRLRGVDLLTAQQDGATEVSDSDLLDRATALGRVEFTHDQDSLRESAWRQQRGQFFTGDIYAHQIRHTIGQRLRDLHWFAHVGNPEGS